MPTRGHAPLEVHGRALKILEENDPRALSLLENFDKRAGTGHGSVHMREIVSAAPIGRISHLFFQNDAHYAGSLEQSGDWIDLAARQTLLHGGEVMILPASRMPNGVPVCALFRYAEAALPTAATS